jgi:OTU domain-containing protein 5
MAATSTNFGRYEEALRRQSLEITSIEGDGNCMFRAVAHQVYGDDRLHMLVRTKCCDYMASEAAYFEPFVEGGIDEFAAYLAHKRTSGVWGDDPEIQACCELYDRPAEIYGFDLQLGARRLRTLHEGNTAPGMLRPPMRLSYYGGEHYDSLVGPGHRENSLAAASAGAVEDLRIAMSAQRSAGGEETKAQSDALATEEVEMDVALAASREDFDRMDGDLDLIFTDQTQLAMAAAEEDQASREVAAVVQAAAEERDLAQALEMSSSAEPASETLCGDPMGDPELRHALEMSMSQSTTQSAEADAELASALAASRAAEEMDEVDGALEVALALSMEKDRLAAGSGAGATATDEAGHEDEEMQRAILLSQEGTWHI